MRRIYRSNGDRKIGGVCGGLGEYFDKDPTLFRLLFVVLGLIYGIGIIIYLIMWLIIPKNPISNKSIKNLTEPRKGEGLGLEKQRKEKSTNKLNDGKKKEDFWHWLLWWQLDEDKLQRQIEQYDTLKITQSARGISFLLVILSNILTLLMITFFNWDKSAFFDIVLFFVLGVFIYRGHQWAMIAGMLYWTYSKIYLMFDKSINIGSSQVIQQIFWWTIYMHVFYQAFKVERLRGQKLINISSTKEEAEKILEEPSEEKIKRKTKRCPYCDEEIPYEAVKCQYCKEFLEKTK